MRTLIAALMFTLALAGCSSSGTEPSAEDWRLADKIVSELDEDAAAEPEPDLSAPADDTAAMEELFITTLELDGIEIGTRESMLDLANAICDGFAAGLDWLSIIDTMTSAEQPRTAYESGYIVAAATATLCPEHAGELP